MMNVRIYADPKEYKIHGPTALIQARKGDIVVYAHPWHGKVPTGQTVNSITKILCADLPRLIAFGVKYGLKSDWVHKSNNPSSIPHFDLWEGKAKEIIALIKKDNELK